MNEKTLRKIYQIQATLGVITGAALFFITPRQLLGFVSGYILATVEFYLLYLVWRRIFDKKPVATTTLLIITKYAVLGVLIYKIAELGTNQLFAFFAGVTSLPASFLILAIKVQISEKKNQRP